MKQSGTIRSFTMATWLGWQVESNWTDPFLFAIYVIIKPLATAAILVVMYSIITGGDYNSPLFPYIYLGNAFYTYVGAVMAGVSWAVIDDREHYKTLKYMYIAPINIPFFWLLSAVKISCGLTPTVASRSWENETKMRSGCSPMMLTFLTPDTCSSC